MINKSQQDAQDGQQMFIFITLQILSMMEPGQLSSEWKQQNYD